MTMWPDTQSCDTVLIGAVRAPARRSPPGSRGALQAGEWVGDRFEIEEFVDAGGMGLVYRAIDRRDDRTVALKVMRPRLADPTRFEQEAALLARLAHPAIVGYVAHGTTATHQRFLAMEWLCGETLAQRLRRGPIDIAGCVMVARSAARALAAAHAHGVVHRDVKPDNLFLVDGALQDVRLIDFGIAYLTTGLCTTPGAVVGTVGYMAPEQACGAPDVDARADVYALGRVLMECLTGERNGPRDCLVPRCAGVPDAFASLLRAMLANERHERPADAAAIVAALDDGRDTVLRAAA